MSYRDALNEAIQRWNSDYIENEWFFEKFRDDTIGKMSPSEAFCFINETIDFLIREDNESTACEILQTIIGLARKSQATEVPNALVENREVIESQFCQRGEYSKGKLAELFRYYRIS
ncbi:hypothetical protein [Aeromonas hydrophila]|uniref:hypothetical protein n=1 Tax=Aeromonas hydrophila TaxID=644 RepID=UPI001F618850|nr:hypothetical protein [Aeromonas hydrophila]UNU28710.1 hypothetical protein GCK65_05995 [Aeromonas hydrophila]